MLLTHKGCCGCPGWGLLCTLLTVAKDHCASSLHLLNILCIVSIISLYLYTIQLSNVCYVLIVLTSRIYKSCGADLVQGSQVCSAQRILLLQAVSDALEH